MVDTHYPETENVVLVLDHLNPHTPASRYAAFPPAEAKRLTDRLEIHDTPKHGSWLNMAELELSVLQRQCLRQRLGDRSAREAAVGAGVDRRTAATARIDWPFTADARTKLRRLYPAFEV